jgi:hypothetical protein
MHLKKQFRISYLKSKFLSVISYQLSVYLKSKFLSVISYQLSVQFVEGKAATLERGRLRTLQHRDRNLQMCPTDPCLPMGCDSRLKAIRKARAPRSPTGLVQPAIALRLRAITSLEKRASVARSAQCYLFRCTR